MSNLDKGLGINGVSRLWAKIKAKFVDLNSSQSLTNKTYNGYSLGNACSKSYTSSVTSGSTSLVTSGGVYTYINSATNNGTIGTWQNASYSSLFSTAWGLTLRYRKIGKTVEIRGSIQPTTSLSGSSGEHTIFTLPSGYRPSTSIYVPMKADAEGVWTLSISPAGVVAASKYSNQYGLVPSILPGTWMSIQIQFFTD